MPENIPVGFGQATYALKHESFGRSFAVTLGIYAPLWGDDYVGIANACHDTFGAAIMPDLDNGIQLTHVDYFVGNGALPSGSVRSTLPPVPGGTAMVTPPMNVCVLVNKETETLGRAGRGRMFIPSSVKRDDVSENGTIEAGFRNSLQSSWNELYDTMVAPGGSIAHQVVPSIIHQSGPLAGTASTVTAFRVGAVVGTRGSRLR